MKIKTKNPVSNSQVKALLQLDQDVATYKAISDQMTTLDVEKKILRDKIMEQVDAIGNRDDNGNLVAATSTHTVTKQKRTKRTMDEDKAEIVLTKRGLLSECTTTETYVDEQKVARAVEQGKLARTDLEEFMVEKDTFALLVKDIKKK